MFYKNYLTDNILPFWTDNAIDKQNGGMFCNLDKTGKVTDFKKYIWFNARALWSFATAYNTIEPKKEYMYACEKIYTFLKKCVLSDGRLPLCADKDGNALEKTELFHGEAHAAMGLAAYYKACKDEDVKNSAIAFFEIAYNMYMSNKARKETDKDGKERYIFGRDMFALSVAQAMRSGNIDDERIEILASECIKNIADTGYINHNLKVVNEYVGCNGEVYDNCCFGHLYEAAWFVLYEGELKKDEKIKNLGKTILDYTITREENKEFEAVRMGSTSDYNEYFWWPQCEAIIAYYLAYNIFKDEFYLNCAKRIEDFAFKSFADKNGAEWFTKCDKYGNVTDSTKGSRIKGVFHLPRMLMTLSALDETGSIVGFM